MSKKILYLECQSGISGDMTVAALLDLGADREAMERALSTLPVTGFHTEVTRVEKSGLDTCDFSVVLDEVHENHDHDMEYLHGHAGDGTEVSYTEAAAEEVHTTDQEHSHEHECSHNH